jgi:hypothetical protein
MPPVWGPAGGGSVPASCPVCKCVPLILFKFSDGPIERARVGCLGRSVVVHHPTNLTGATLQCITKHPNAPKGRPHGGAGGVAVTSAWTWSLK